VHNEDNISFLHDMGHSFLSVLSKLSPPAPPGPMPAVGFRLAISMSKDDTLDMLVASPKPAAGIGPELFAKTLSWNLRNIVPSVVISSKRSLAMTLFSHRLFLSLFLQPK
jgi:hypothetical protein